MSKTQAERLDDVDTKLELLVTQQRVVIQQNDKILEFMGALYEGLAGQDEEEKPEVPGLSAADAVDMLKDLSGPAEPDKHGPSAARSWGRNGH